MDRKTPIARVVPLDDEAQGLRIEASSAPPAAVGRVKGVRLRRRVDVDTLLAESRSQG